MKAKQQQPLVVFLVLTGMFCTLLVYVCSLGFVSGRFREALRDMDKSSAWPRNSTEVRDLVQRVYDGVDGFAMSVKDVQASQAENTTFKATYGEFHADGVSTLLDALNVTMDDVFCDLGSGTGKVVMQTLLERRPREAIGVELGETRYENAIHARDRLAESLGVRVGPKSAMYSRLNFVHGDMFKLDEIVQRCSKIFVCTTVMPAPLLERIQDLFLRLPFESNLVRIASSRELKGFGTLLEPKSPKSPRAAFEEHVKVMTSWGMSFVSIYTLKKA